MSPKQLNNGTSIPPIGLGLWRVKDEQTCITAVQEALLVGFRHLDTAQIYGNEAFVGKAGKSSGVPREELFITTKIWNENQFWDDLPLSFDESLRNLQTDYVDLLLLHFPVTETRRPAWRQMEKLAASGRARAIGVSNYTVRHLEELLRECTVRPAVNQVELHVYLQQPELVQFCHDNGILVEAYSPLAHGYGLDNSVLVGIAQKHHKSPAQVMIRWTIDRGFVPLPKSVHPDRIRENFEVFDFSLDAADMAILAGLDSSYRTCWDPTHVA
jgi:diketogulonate reductase-like aldo/keto reductase